MYTLTIKGEEFFDDERECFVYGEDRSIQIEHSLYAIYEWESKWNKPFLDKKDKTWEETIDYIKCMTVTPNVDPSFYDSLSGIHVEAVNEYMNRKMTATTIKEIPGRGGGGRPGSFITAEIIYYWMFRCGIPLEWEHRHLNQVLTMVKVCTEKDSPPKKMSKRDAAASRKSLNAARMAKLHTKG